MKNIFPCIFLFLLSICTLKAQIAINTAISPPYPTDLDYYIEDLTFVYVSLNNTTATSQTFYLKTVVYGPSQLQATIDYLVPFTLAAGETRVYDGRQLAEFGRTTDGFSNTNNLSEEQIQAITINRALPEGNYQICFEAYDENDVLISDPSSGCSDFEITYVDRPWIFTPETGETIPAINVSWAHDLSNISPEERNRVTYRVHLIDATENNLVMTVDEIMASVFAGSYQFETKSTTMPVLDGVDALLVEGHEYVVFVTAFDPEGRLMFYDRGNSNLVSFFYKVNPNEEEDEDDEIGFIGCIEEETEGNDCSNPVCDFYFPLDRDTLPFNILPCLVRFDPYCSDYKKLIYNFTLNDETDNSPMQTNSGDNTWPVGGPLQYLRNIGDADATEDHARTFMLSTLGNRLDSDDVLIRSHTYRAAARTVMEMRDGTRFTQTNEINFVVGMPKPLLEKPAHKDTLSPGDIRFKWDNGALPAYGFPDFSYVRRLEGSDGDLVESSYFGDVAEKWVLQISKTDRFGRDDIVFGLQQEVGGSEFNSVEELMSGIYVINDKNIKLETEGTYYWRVVWLKSAIHDVSLDGYFVAETHFYHKSNTIEFTISDEAPVTSGEDSEGSESECSSPCTFPALTSTTASGGVTVGSSFTAAGFTIEVRESSGGSSSNGYGYVIIPFLNNIKLRVNFSGVAINASRQMVNGTIIPVKDDGFPFRSEATVVGRVIGMSQGEAEGLAAALEAGDKLTSLLTSGAETTLPIGIDRTIDGQQIVIGIPNLTIKKDTAHMDIVVNLNLPNLDALGGFLSLGAQVCITNGGFGNDVRLYLPQDHIFLLGDGNEFRIKGAEGSSDPRNITSVEWNCNGFKALNIVGAVRFTREWIVPEDDAGVIHATNNVEARFGGRVTNGGHVMLRLDMDRFQIKDVEGWGFRLQNGYIDLSDLENPTELVSGLPSGYNHAAFNAGGEANTWKGFFLQGLEVRTPESFRGSSSERLTFAMRNMIIDETGISFSARAENILRWDGSGDMNGWSASLDTVFFDIVQNNFRSFGLSGKIGLPIADNNDPGSRANYRAMLNHSSAGLDLVINIRPAADMRIPISMATATIRDESYITTIIGNRSVIEANLCATLSLGSRNLAPGGPSMAGTFNLPGLSIENLLLSSESGIGGPHFRYSLTGMGGTGSSGGSSGGGYSFDDDIPLYLLPPDGGESTLSGFPIGLEHLSFGNEGVSIEPRLTLSSDGTGIAASARILLRIQSPDAFRSFQLTGVDLQRISLNVETSDVKLAGYLEFYKEAGTAATPSAEGVRGGVIMEINLGTRIGAQINADFGVAKSATARAFNTPEWYSYFAVDGMVFIGSGITLFSGISLYGIGGGFYHHMRPNEGSTLPGGSAVVTSPVRTTSLAESSLSEDSIVPDEPYDSSKGSGVRYLRDWNTLFGFQFMAILGSNDMGKAYNIDVKIEALFSPSGGMTNLGLTGTFRVMTDGISVATIGREGNSPVAGYVNLNLSMPAGGPVTFNGQFFVKLAVPYSSPILRGAGTVPSPPPGWTAENAMVWANIYFGPDKWYFHMGTPTNRCGVRLTIGDRELFRLTSYLMIGHDIPVLLPEPEAEFTRIFNKGMRPDSDFRSPDGDVNNLLAGRPRPPMPLGTGFAFGIAMAMNTGDIEFFPFFFNLSAVMGCDINMTHATPEADRRCAGSSRVPGTDGWYATGQFYAGIEGAFGIKVNLFVTEIKATILEASAALILEGGLPNPEWVSGRGSFYYNVCDGLVTGRCTFTLEAGTVCRPTVGNPFGGITIIQDISPKDGSTNVSVYTNTAAAFSMEMDRIFEIPEYKNATDPPLIRRLQPYMSSFEIRKVGTSKTYTGPGNWRDNNFAYELTPINRLDPDHHHTITVKARIREHTAGGSSDMTSRGMVYEETKTSNFWTGPEPDHIVDENLFFTYPYVNQRQFLKGETQGNRGYVVCKSGDNGFFKPSTESGMTTSFIARISTQASAPVDVPATVFGTYKGVYFDVSQLQNENLYCIQIIRKDVPETSATFAGLSGLSSSVVGGLSNPPSASLQIVNFSSVIGLNTIQSNQYKRVTLPAGRVGRNERQLYALYFKTSKYNTMREKMLAQGTWNFTLSSFGYDIPELNKTMTENFEYADNQSFRVIGHATAKEFTPRTKLWVEIPGPGSSIITKNQYLQNVAKPKVFDQLTRALGYRQSLLSGTYLTHPIISLPEISFTRNYSEYNPQVFIRSDAPIHPPLTTSEITGAFTEYASSPTGSFGLGIITGLPIFTPRPTYIQYLMSAKGENHYSILRQQFVNFAQGRGSISLAGMGVPFNVWDIMNTEQRAFFQNHINRVNLIQRIQHMETEAGRHSFGLKYVFPNQSGSDVDGSIFEFNFNFPKR